MPIAASLIIAGGLVAWFQPWKLEVGPRDSENAAGVVQDKPSIAVLPFDNLSGDPDQDYFADGIAEDLITSLSRLRWLYVTARNSTFTYKGQAVDVKRVGRELGARYVLEGSVRRGGNRVRVTAQLIDAKSGNHVWAQRFDRELTDIFETHSSERVEWQDQLRAIATGALGIGGEGPDAATEDMLRALGYL